MRASELLSLIPCLVLSACGADDSANTDERALQTESAVYRSCSYDLEAREIREGTVAAWKNVGALWNQGWGRFKVAWAKARDEVIDCVRYANSNPNSEFMRHHSCRDINKWWALDRLIYSEDPDLTLVAINTPRVDKDNKPIDYETNWYSRDFDISKMSLRDYLGRFDIPTGLDIEFRVRPSWSSSHSKCGGAVLLECTQTTCYKY